MSTHVPPRPMPAPAPSSPWSNRRADASTDDAPTDLPPPNLADAALRHALQTAFRHGFVAGEVNGESDHYMAGWRFGVVCGFVLGAIVFCGLFKLGYLIGLAQ